MHVVSHRLASLVGLIALNKSTRKRVVLLKLIVAGSLVIAEHTSDGQVLRASIEDHAGWLRHGRAHMDCSEVDSIVAAVKWNLQLEVISVIFGCIGYLADQLGGMDVGLATLLALLFSFY